MKKLLLITGLIIVSGNTFAKPVNLQKAKIIANHFMAGKLDAASLNINLEATYGEPQPAFYIFNINQNKGFVIVSADDIIIPILGYSTEGPFITKNNSPELNYWLEGYKGQIKNAISRELPTAQKIKDQWTNLLDASTPPENSAQKITSVSPLLTTTWDQMPYYNELCPVPGGNYSSTPAGCVATAMAQIMNYWQYPAQGIGSHAYAPASNISGTLNANFGAANYDWASMPPKLTSIATVNQVNAIATLMFHCGVAVEMDYNTAASGGSGAFVIDYNYSPNQPCSENAFKDYFGYKSTISGLRRQGHPEAIWISMLKNELDNGRPILYAGFGGLGGHAFDFDGYDNNDMFHINWGWNGMSNGYFTVNNLAPAGLGVGGGGGNFNDDQEALIGIEPGAEISHLMINNPVDASATSIEFNTAYSISAEIKNNGNADFNNGTLYLIAADTSDPANTRLIIDSIATSIAKVASYTYNFSTTGINTLTPATYFIIYGYSEQGGNSIHPVSVNNGTATNSTALLTVSEPNGISQKDQVNTYSIYPNPAKDNLMIAWKDASDPLISFALFDMHGKEVAKQNVKENNLNIPLGTYADGIYILKLQSVKNIITQKITIQK